MKAGDRVLTYIVERELGEGGMGTVYLGRHTVLNQQVAIKALSPLLARDQALRERFIQEANIQAGLRHPGVVQVLTADMEGEQPLLIMEYIEGKSLFEVVNFRGKLPVEDALKIMEQVFAAVGYAHRQGVIHRDLKPENVMVMAHGEARVTDFGIARVLGSARLTRTGTAMGSAYYMSPEQILNPDSVDARSDIYALGCVFYEVLSGRPPFGEKAASGTDNDFKIKTAHVNETVPALGSLISDTPEWLASLVMTMLEKDPEKRPASCEAILEQLKAGGKVDSPQSEEAAGKSSSEQKHRTEKEDRPQEKQGKKVFLIMTVAAIVGLFIFFIQSSKTTSDQHASGQNAVPVPPVERAAEIITQQAEQLAQQIEAGNPNNLVLCPENQTEFQDNCWGEHSWPDGEKYVGEYKDGNANGLGIRTWPDGEKYAGTYKDGKVHGKGKFVFVDGEKYAGEFKDGKIQGGGTMTFTNGDKYVGEFKGNKRTGQGVYKYASGAKYVGEFMDTALHGQAIKYKANGSVEESGIYKNGRIVKSEHVDPDSFSHLSK
jgi:serine/threonine-protein kinase